MVRQWNRSHGTILPFITLQQRFFSASSSSLPVAHCNHHRTHLYAINNQRRCFYAREKDVSFQAAQNFGGGHNQKPLLRNNYRNNNNNSYPKQQEQYQNKQRAFKQQGHQQHYHNNITSNDNAGETNNNDTSPQHHHHDYRIYHVQRPLPTIRGNAFLTKLNSLLDAKRLEEAEQLFYQTMPKLTSSAFAAVADQDSENQEPSFCSSETDAVVSTNSCNMLLHVYILRHLFDKAAALFSHMKRYSGLVDAQTYDLMIASTLIQSATGYCNDSNLTNAMLHFRDLLHSCATILKKQQEEKKNAKTIQTITLPLPNTICNIMEAFIAMGKHQDAIQFFNHAFNSPIGESITNSGWVYLSLVKSLVALDKIQELRAIVFEKVAPKCLGTVGSKNFDMTFVEFTTRLVNEFSKLNSHSFTNKYKHSRKQHLAFNYQSNFSITAKHLLEESIAKGLIHVTNEKVLLAYIDVAAPHEAEHLLKQALQEAAKTQNNQKAEAIEDHSVVTPVMIINLMRSYIKHNQVAQAEQVLLNVKSEFKVKPQASFYNIMLDTCNNIHLYHAHALIHSTVNGFSAIAQLQSFIEAKVEHLLEQMRLHHCSFDSYTFNILIRIYGKGKHLDKVHSLIDQMLQHGETPNHFTLSILLNMYSRMDSTTVSQLDALMYEYQSTYHLQNCENNIIVQCAYLKALVQLNKIEKAAQHVHKLEKQGLADATTYCTLLHGYVMHMRVKDAERLFEYLKSKNMDGIVSCTLMIRLYANTEKSGPEFDKIEQIVNYCLQAGFPISHKFVSTLLYAFEKKKRSYTEFISEMEKKMIELGNRQRQKLRAMVEEYEARKIQMQQMAQEPLYKLIMSEEAAMNEEALSYDAATRLVFVNNDRVAMLPPLDDDFIMDMQPSRKIPASIKQ